MTMRRLLTRVSDAGLTIAVLALLPACPPARVTVTVGPTRPPPAVHPSPVDCPSTAYYRHGRYQWSSGRYVFRHGRCVPRPASWHAGCRWVPGRWVHQGRTYRFAEGHVACLRRTTQVVPLTLPPPLRPATLRCGRAQYLQRGYWQWRTGRWQWRAGRCRPRPARWAVRGCRYQPATWRRVGRRVELTPGRVVCRHAPAGGSRVRRCTPAMRRAGRCR